MKQGENIADAQKRFAHIVNHLKVLGKVFQEKELNVKVLKSLNRTWQPKVTTILKSKYLTSMTHAKLFGKLREYDMNMTWIAKEEEKEQINTQDNHFFN